MYVLNAMPATLAAMLEFLQPTVEDGLFDSVEYDNESNPTKIVCTKDSNVILDVSGSNKSWDFKPYVASGTAASTNHAYSTNSSATKWKLIRCTGGVYLRASFDDGSGAMFIMAKTSGEKTGFIYASPPSTGNFNVDFVSKDVTYYTTCFGDDTTLALYANGYYVHNNRVADRTILTKLPVVGSQGSTDYFSTAFVRNVVQYAQEGVQQIGSKKYGCSHFMAIEDNGEEE